MWRADVITLYPDMFPGPLGQSLAGKAQGHLWQLATLDLRAFGHGRHRAVDDRPAGGGPGMVLRADVIAAAIDSLGDDGRPRLLMSPRGRPLDQARVRALAAGQGAVIMCGRFEGVDERVIEKRGFEEVSIGDFILSGGELAALVLIDACVRLIDGVMGKIQSGESESFEKNLLEYPQFTRPRQFEGAAIPAVLLDGDHGKITAWRREQAEHLTATRRPDLWARYAAAKSLIPKSTKKPKKDG